MNPTQDDMNNLKAWLQANEIENVLIPCERGVKYPLFNYKGSIWDWSAFETWTKSDTCVNAVPTFDWAIILKTMAVVDVDDMDVMASLEARFPCLLECPAVLTKKGKHYYFKRSKRCNTDGYFDSQGQAMKFVDFKTLTPTGSGGLIMVPPSTNKTWIRPIWNTPLIDIPEDLLMAVAVAGGPTNLSLALVMDDVDATNDATLTHSTSASTSVSDVNGGGADDAAPKDRLPSDAKIYLAFENEDDKNMLVDGARLQLLQESSYFAALLSGRWTSAETSTEGEAIPVLQMPCSRIVCKEIFSILAKEELTHETEPTIGLLSKIDQTIDMLGLNYSKNPLLLRSTFFADLFNISRTWYSVHREELRLTLGTSAEMSDFSLVEIDDELAMYTGYEPLKKDSRWLFESLPTYVSQKNIRVFVDEPAVNLLAELPPVVVALLKRYPTNIVVAGGAVLGGVSKFARHGTDVDLFVHSLEQTESSNLLKDIEKFVDDKYKDEYVISSTLAAITFTQTQKESSGLLNRPFQVVLALHRSRAQVLEYFDIAPAKCLARIDVATNELIVEGLPSFVLSLTNMAFIVDIKFWSPSSVTRITKYVGKGFECCIPGLKREAFKKVLTVNASHFKSQKSYWSRGNERLSGPTQYPNKNFWSRGVDCVGMGVLFVAESEVLRSRAYTGSEDFEFIDTISGRLKPIEASVIAAKAAGQLRSGTRISTRTSTMYSHLTGRSSSTKRTGTYGYIRESFRRDIAQRIGDNRNGVPFGTKFFKFTDAGRFKPEDAHMAEMYDEEVLSNIASKEIHDRANSVVCAHCGISNETLIKDESRKLLSCCAGVKYCSKHHQKMDWKRHKNCCIARKKTSTPDGKRRKKAM